MQFPRLTIRESSPFCDSDEEVFFGPVTSKELEKASKLKRRTQVYIPGADRKLGQVSLNEAAFPQEGSDHALTVCGLQEDPNKLDKKTCLTIENKTSKDITVELGDSLEEKFQQNCSFKAEDSLESNCLTSLNVAHIASACSLDSLDKKSDAASTSVQSDDSLNSKSGNQAAQSSAHSDDSLDQKSPIHLQCTSLSEDSLDKKSPNLAQVETFSVCSDDSLNGSSRQLSSKFLSQHPDARNSLQSENLSSESESIFQSAQICLLQSQSHDLLNIACANSVQSDDSTISAVAHSLPLDCGSDQSSLKSYKSAMACSVEPDVAQLYPFTQESFATVPDEVDEASGDVLQNTLPCAIKDDDIKSSMSEELVISLSSSENNLNDSASVDKDGGYLSILSEAALYHASKSQPGPSNHGHQSLEDRFHEFGVGADDLEKQHLSESIMYTTGRESCLYNVSAYFPSKVLQKNEMETNENEVAKINTGSVSVDAISSENPAPSAFPKSGEKKTTEDKHLSANVESLQEHEPSFESVADYEQDGETHDDSTEMHTAHSDITNSSVASSVSERMNDTLEEYEMIMRYGVDYILGSTKKNSGGDDGCRNEVDKKGNTTGANHSSPETGDGVETACPSSRSDEGAKCDKLSSPSPKNCDDKGLKPREAGQTTPKRNLTPFKRVFKQSPCTTGSLTKSSPKIPVSGIPRAPPRPPAMQLQTPSPRVVNRQTPHCTNTGPGVKSAMFKKPVHPVSASRLPKYTSNAGTPKSTMPKSNQKVLGNIQSPVSAYIHNTASPVLVTNVKAKVKEVPAWENEMYARALWKAGECKSSIPKPTTSQVSNIENINPDEQCGLPAVKYMRAPCIKLGESGNTHLPKVSEKITKLLDTPCPQVIKHEGRLNFKSGSPQLAAKVQAVTSYPDDSMVGIGCAPGDVSVCISKAAVRTDTLSFKSPSKPSAKYQ